MKSFKAFALLTEGGNVKIGDHQASPIDVKKMGRSNVHSDVKGALESVHDSFHKAHGKDLFGPKKAALHSGSVYSGSTKSLFDKKIPDAEFTKHKSSVGDVDVKVPKEHLNDLKDHIKVGDKHGKYTVTGTKRSGTELHALMKHENGKHHQFDFEGSEYHKGAPHPFEQFAHSAHWDDTKSGIKGVHHKILLNAVGGDKHKFAISKGLGSRTDDTKPWIRDTHKITHTLFGKNADETKIHSFKGLTHLIKHHIPSDHHQAVASKFESSLKSSKGIDHTHALSHLHKELGTHSTESLSESTSEKSNEKHVSVVPLVGFSPFSHEGHRLDLGRKLHSLPGEKHVGMSSKEGAFSPSVRKGILARQWKEMKPKVHATDSAGKTIRHAFDSIKDHKGKKVLHLLVGADRKKWGDGLKDALHNGKIKEMEHHKFDEIHVHQPDDVKRTHGMSGTNMRAAAMDGDSNEFHRHVGPNFSRAESNHLMNKVSSAIKTGKLKLKR